MRTYHSLTSIRATALGALCAPVCPSEGLGEAARTMPANERIDGLKLRSPVGTGTPG